ncbi:MAG: TolC family protein [Sphingobacteriales bacterium]|nr:TolC family protein [Sphingobacteriales bacterium]
MKKVQLIFLFVHFGITQEALSQQKTINGQMTFGEAVQIMLTNNHSLKQSEYLLKQKQSESRVAKSYYLPQVGLSGGYMAMQKDLKLDLTPVRDAITPLYSTLGQYGNFSGVPNPDPNTNKVMPILPDNISTNVVREKCWRGCIKYKQQTGSRCCRTNILVRRWLPLKYRFLQEEK